MNQENAPVLQYKGALDENIARQLGEVQAAIFLAKQFPRDVEQAKTAIKAACKRKALAEEAVYLYPRGKSLVSGPSIRLAEVLAQNWQNLDFGLKEISQRDGVAEVEAYCWDMQTNVRSRKVFSVELTRYTKKGSYNLTDSRDKYEMIANNGMRRVRACIMAVIPGDVIDDAVKECERTVVNLVGDTPEKVKKELSERILKLQKAFQEIGVTKNMLEIRIDKSLKQFDVSDFALLTKIYRTIKDGIGEIGQYFTIVEPVTKKEAKDLQAKLEAARGNGKNRQAQTETPEETPAAEEAGQPEAQPELFKMDTIDLCNEIRHNARAKAKKIKGDLKKRLDEWIGKERAAASPDDLDEREAREWITILRNL